MSSLFLIVIKALLTESKPYKTKILACKNFVSTATMIVQLNVHKAQIVLSIYYIQEGSEIPRAYSSNVIHFKQPK